MGKAHHAFEPLTEDLLGEYVEASERLGAPFGRSLGEGLSDAAIDTLLRPTGLEVPTEIRTLWRWATVRHSSTVPGSWAVHAWFELLPPALAVRATLERRAGLYGHDPFPDSWLAFAAWRDPYYLVVDQSRAHDGVAPVVFRDEGGDTPAAPSLGALFRYWIAQIEAGEIYYDSDTGWWKEAHWLVRGPLHPTPGDDA